VGAQGHGVAHVRRGGELQGVLELVAEHRHEVEPYAGDPARAQTLPDRVGPVPRRDPPRPRASVAQRRRRRRCGCASLGPPWSRAKDAPSSTARKWTGRPRIRECGSPDNTLIAKKLC
jgi:hypothetical protein